MGKSTDLQALREALDGIDRRLIALLAERMALAERVAAAKLDAAFPFRDREREDRLLVHLRRLAAEAGRDVPRSSASSASSSRCRWRASRPSCGRWTACPCAFGFYPARKASRLLPIEALRSE